MMPLSTPNNTVPATFTAYTVLRHLTPSVRAVRTVWATSPTDAVRRTARVHGPAAYRVLLNGRRVY